MAPPHPPPTGPPRPATTALRVGFAGPENVFSSCTSGDLTIRLVLGPFPGRRQARRFERPRNLDLSLMDVAGRLRLQISPRSIVQLKLNYYDETSAATYLGITGPPYALSLIHLSEPTRPY